MDTTPSLDERSSKRTAAHWLWAARLAWFLMAVISLVIFARGVPVFVETLHWTYGANFGLWLQRTAANEIILMPHQGEQAAQAGVMERDVLIAVDGEPVSKTNAALLEELIPAGAAGTAVTLQIRTGNQPLREVTLIRGDRAGVWLNRFNVPVAAVVGVAVGMELFVTLGFIAVAAFIFWRGGETPIVWLSSLVLVQLFAGAGSLPVQNLYFAELDWQYGLDIWFSLMVVALLLFLFLFPSGRFVPRWSLILMPLSFVWVTAAWVWPDLYFWRLTPRPYLLILTIFLLSGVAAQLWRYRIVSSPEQRQQTKWVVWGIGVALTALFIQFATGLLLPPSPPLFDLLINPLTRLAQLVIPITFALAIFQRSLWQIDAIVNRTMVYGGLTVLITAIYILLVGGVGTMATGTQSHMAAFIVATILVCVGIRPFYHRLQAIINQIAPYPAPPTIEPEEQHSEGASIIFLRLIWLVIVLFAAIIFLASTILVWRDHLLGPHEATRLNIDAAIFDLVGQDFLASPVIFLAAALQLVPFVAMGLFIYWRQPVEPLAVMTSWMLITAGIGFWPTTIVLPFLQPWWHIPVTLLQAIFFSSIIYFLTLFPDGRFEPRWSRFLAFIWTANALSWLVSPALNPYRSAQFTGLILFVVFCALGFAAQIVRYRRTETEIERQQMKWVIGGLGTTTACFAMLVILKASGYSFGKPGVANFTTGLLGLSSILLPLTIGIAMLRYRLYDARMVLNRTLVYGSLSLGIVLVYVLVVGALGTLFQTQDNIFLALLATGLIAVLFQPIRDRLQRAANRLMFGERDDPYAILTKLGTRLQTTSTPEMMLQSVVETVAATLKLPYVAIELVNEQGRLRSAAVGTAVAETVDFALRYQNETVGYLVVSPRSPGEPFSAHEQQLLNNVAGQTGAVAYSVRLTSALQRTATALQASREKLVLTREEERRRIRRDLHDELGPTLASQTFALDAAIDLLEHDPQAAATLLRSLKTQNQQTVADIRRLVYELRPPSLDELGLLGSLQAYVGQLTGAIDLQIQLSAQPDPLPPLSAAVEVAAYRIGLEALNNVARHARATQCSLAFSVVESPTPLLQIIVTDNGIGLSPRHSVGIGHQSMRERAEELGGRIKIENGEKGVQLTAVLPLTSHQEETVK